MAKKVVVTGCHGQLGRAIKQILAEHYQLINTDVAELDITDVSAVLALVRETKPYGIINCAAYTAVDKCEEDMENAYRINAIGTRNLAMAAREAKAKLVHISTDYVFDGRGNMPYTEFDPTGPIGVYGASKLAGENFVKEFADQYFIVRTAWLYGEGANFVRTMLRLSKEKKVVQVVADQIGTPTSAVELARAIAWLLPTDEYGLYHGTCAGECSWADLAEATYRLMGLKMEVERISTAEYKTAAKRPAYSVLRNYMLELIGGYRFAYWHDALKEHLKNT